MRAAVHGAGRAESVDDRICCPIWGSIGAQAGGHNFRWVPHEMSSSVHLIEYSINQH